MKTRRLEGAAKYPTRFNLNGVESGHHLFRLNLSAPFVNVRFPVNVKEKKMYDVT